MEKAPSSQTFTKQELLDWVNNFNDIVVKVRKVESLCSGAIYCQLVNHLFPGCVPCRKIRYNAVIGYDCRENLKLLQSAFRRIGCTKDIPIEKMITGRYHDNFEFLRWFRKFYEANNTAITSISSPLSLMNISEGEASTPDVPKKNVANIISTTPRARAVEKSGSAPKKLSKEVEHYKDKIAELKEKSQEDKKARIFYFKKLRNIEAICAEACEDKEVILAKISAELYATSSKAEEQWTRYDEETY